MNKNGVVSFSELLTESSPDPNMDTDFIAPLWTDFEVDYQGGVFYQEVTSGPLLFQVTQDINTMFPGKTFYATWLFIATWQTMSFINNTGVRMEIPKMNFPYLCTEKLHKFHS